MKYKWEKFVLGIIMMLEGFIYALSLGSIPFSFQLRWIFYRIQKNQK